MPLKITSCIDSPRSSVAGKFKAPTAVASPSLHRETSAAELYDLQGRRVQQPAAGTVVVSRNGKHIAQ